VADQLAGCQDGVFCIQTVNNNNNNNSNNIINNNSNNNNNNNNKSVKYETTFVAFSSELHIMHSVFCSKQLAAVCMRAVLPLHCHQICCSVMAGVEDMTSGL
jgi:hypothetical protein